MLFSVRRRRPAGLFVTHVINERILRHFDRLKRQCGHLVHWRLIYNQYTLRDLAENWGSHTTPANPRVNDALRHGSLQMGYLDLLVVPLALDTHRHQVWVMEYDVDYSGDWATFFSKFQCNSADLLTTTLNTRDRDPNWAFWPTAVAPANVPSHLRTRAFLPAFRVSQRFLSVYHRAVSTGQWQGHYEFLFPTIARGFGLTIQDIGGEGPFTPKHSVGHNYLNTPSDPHLSPGTFVWRPSMPAYFHESPERFMYPDMLYHPVKPAVEEWNPSKNRLSCALP